VSSSSASRRSNRKPIRPMTCSCARSGNAMAA
jgi:hypothetical protein